MLLPHCRCDSMTDILALTTGVTLRSIGEDVITVRIEQLLPEELQTNGAAAGRRGMGVFVRADGQLQVQQQAGLGGGREWVM